ncbi:MAG TPA: nucleotidyltransferase domain-containing protein [Candidatus Nitrosotenuis sp.]|jgi:predicted nucleotidyltransferase
MSTESDLAQRVEKHFAKEGWSVRREVKIRGRIVDIVAIKDGQIAAVEVKGAGGDVEKGIMQSLHQKGAVNLSYLAIPQDTLTDSIKSTCRNLGIGLILVDKKIKEAIRPKHTSSLISVKNKILGKESQKRSKVIESKSPLEIIFRTKSQILALKLLFLNTSKEFHLNEIARRTGLTPPAVSKELAKLVRAGLVKRRNQGNLSFYKINEAGIIFGEMKRIFLKYEIFSEILSRELAKEKIKYALIYGSFAKGTEKEGSDIDLLVVGDVSEDYLLRVIPRIERNTGREINFILWTEKEFGDKVQKKIPLIREILETPIIMIVGDEDGFKRALKERIG